ncbi:MAG: pitrilysin family protein [Thermodesulfobacteriota bacterium]
MYQKTTLDNGIRIVTEDVPYVNSVSIGVWVVLGSRDEKRNENGISHFIEHMLFKGTKNRTAMQIAKEIDSVGGILNACTSKEYTSFYAKVLTKDLPLAIDLLSDILLKSTFDPKEIDKERQVILQEICMVEDTPDEYIQELFNRVFFREHPLGYPVIGEPETVGTIDRDRMINFFKEYYTSNRIIIAVCGNVKHDEVVRMIEDDFGSLPKKDGYTAKDLPNPISQVLIQEKELEQIHICLGSKGPSQTHPLRYASYILNAVLGGGMSSRLFQEIREKRGLVYSVYSYMSAYFDTGLFTIYAGTDGDALRKVIKLVIKELKGLKINALKKRQLQMAKEQLKGNLILACENIDNRMSRLAKSEIYFGKFITVDEIINGIEKVTSEEITHLAEEIFNKDYLSLAVLGHMKEKDFTNDLLEV